MLAGPFELDITGDDQPVLAADQAVEAFTVVAQPGADLAIVEASVEAELKVDPPSYALDDAE